MILATRGNFYLRRPTCAFAGLGAAAGAAGSRLGAVRRGGGPHDDIFEMYLHSLFDLFPILALQRARQST